MKSHNNLIAEITSNENMLRAYERTAKAKRMTFGYLEFKEFKQLNLNMLSEELRDGSYKVGKYREFIIYEPKPRLISALDFKDRLAQHALIGVIEKIFDETFLPNAFACRNGLGTHAGVRYIHHELKHRQWARYMDDVVILGDNIDRLRDDFYNIAEFSSRNLGLRISKWHCANINKGINFLGYRIWNSHKLIRKDSVYRAKRKIKKYIRSNDNESLDKFLASWRGHASWADSNNLFNWLERLL